MSLSWYVARTESRAELLAANELRRDGFEIFFPQVNIPGLLNTRQDAPLFPGYMFIRCDPEGQGWPSFRSSHRILGWVRFGGQVPSLRDEVIDELRVRWESINEEGGIWRRYRQGEKVRVVYHNMETLAEVVEEAKSPQSRAKVLMHFMGRMVPAQVPWGSLQPVADPPDGNRRLPRRTRGKGRRIGGPQLVSHALVN